MSCNLRFPRFLWNNLFETDTFTIMKRTFLLIAILFSTFLFTFSQSRAPELIPIRGWLNTDKPLSINSLHGKIVLLDFWTYGCINCMHIIPELKRLEAKYPNELVVIGVHSAKFENEGQTENIRKIILRYGIEHPVANDADFRIWRSYFVNAYPTRVLIDANGIVRKRTVGERGNEEIDAEIQNLIGEAKKSGKLNETPLKLALEKAKVADTPLSFPSKVLADEKSDRLFISDTNHNRIVIAKLDGTLLEVIGSGKQGFTNGSYTTATFNHPNGMALDGDNLYVADTQNHSIRAINLATKTVSTIAGTGKQGSYTAMQGKALKTALNSPWDLQVVENVLFIAIAGQHQIWKLDFTTQQVSQFAGSGSEARQDGDLLESAFAQPSGLLIDGENLFVADSESNIIRNINLTKGEVKTLVGGDLYDFGDVDGSGDNVRLQHPLGLAKYGTSILIADTYNHKIKILDTENKTVKTFLGSGKSGNVDGKTPTFWEPGGISIAKGKLYVADTNNQSVRVVDLQTKETTTLLIKGLMPSK
jgi:DNA-binding beta-propeller fold protein YncE/thiol-disulfide isomerase/thioredoxin